MLNVRQRRQGEGGGNGYHAIVKRIRGDIVSSRLAPGDRLPTRRELQVRFHTTPVTVNRAMQMLVQHGYVEARGRGGSFVTRYPPHVSHFAIAFPWAPDGPPSQFFRAIQNEAAKLRAPSRRVSVFHDIGPHVDVEDYQRLLGLVTAHRLAGLVFAHNPLALEGTPLFKDPELPRVAVALPNPKIKFPTVYPDLDSFGDKAFACLASRGRRRIGAIVLAHTAVPLRAIDTLQRSAARHGLDMRPWWVQGGSIDASLWARQAALAMFQGTKSERPDGLVIFDDNLVPYATMGIEAAGVQVPRDLDVVAMANFPWPMPRAVPVIHLGYDIARLVAVCMERIGQQRGGANPPAHTPIPAVFEEELAERV